MTGSTRLVTLADVARHAGVSLATASRAINGSTRTVNAELQERVLASATALRYSANSQAQAVARGSSKTVALVLGDIADPYFSSIAAGVMAAAKSFGLVATMATVDSDDELTTLAALRGQHPKVILLAGSRHVDPAVEEQVERELDAFTGRGGRVAVIGGPSARYRSLDVHNRDSAGQLAESLIDLGYRDFLVLAGPAELVTSTERSRGFLEGAEGRGIEISPHRLVNGALSRDGGYETMSSVLATGARPECVFAVTDVMAVGAMAAIRDSGLVPGRDIAMAGYDDIRTLQDVTPSLTTVALPLLEMGASALALALADDDQQSISFAGRVVIRHSTPGLPRP